MLDILINICAVFVLSGGLWLGYLGVSGHLSSQRLLGLWVFYGTLVFVLTGLFLYFHKRIAETPPAQGNKPRAYMTVTAVALQNLTIGQKPRVFIEYTASGQAAAHQVQLSSRITLATEQDLKPDYSDLQVVKIEPILAPPTKMFSTVFASWEVTKQKFEEIREGRRWIYAYGTIEYADEAGNKFPLYKYCFRYDYRSGGFAYYTPPDTKDIEDYLTPGSRTMIDIARPKIVVTKIALGDVAVDSHPRYEVVFMNVSATKATLKAAASTFLALMTVPMSETPQYPQLASPPNTVEFMPKEERPAKATADFTLTSEDLRAMKEKKLWLYVYGFVIYEDETGHSYQTRFCGGYDTDTERLVLCDHHNSAD